MAFVALTGAESHDAAFICTAAGITRFISGSQRAVLLYQSGTKLSMVERATFETITCVPAANRSGARWRHRVVVFAALFAFITPVHSVQSAQTPVVVAVNEVPTLKQVFQQLSESKPATDTGAEESQQANVDQPLEILAEQVDEFARTEHAGAERVEVSVIPVDRRLRLKRCDVPVSYTWTSATKTMGNTTVTAHCEGSAPWKVLIRAQVRVFHTIPTLTVPVNKGDVLTSDMVTSRLFDVSSLRRETLRSVDNVIGYRFKRRLAAGREISSAILAAPLVVSKGDQVLISDSNAVLDVQLKGTAMSGGEVGRKISVRSNSSGRVIQTWIRGPGLVVVSP